MRCKSFKHILKGGALIGALFLTSGTSVLAYDQNNTHPALTDEIVDFYNLNFPNKKLNNQDKQWLIQGSKDEDSGERPLFHFYDPVHNRGIAGGTSSKQWALASGIQANYYNSQQTGFAAFSNAPSVGDFSYQRALDDYAKGDKKRAFLAFGHVLHLLEDAGVPDHTRNDPHPSFIHGQESPYEKEMAKWNPGNLQVARELFLKREKPVTFYTMESYFDRVANFSNNNFFSKDTINNQNYSNPSVKITKKLNVNGKELLFIVGRDSSNKEFPIAYVQTIEKQNKTEVVGKFLVHEKIGDTILNNYWPKLSKEVVLNGTGALNLFLNEAERAKEEYARKPMEKTSLWAQLLGLVGIGDTSDNVEADFDGVDNGDNTQGLVTDTENDGDTKLLPIVSPKLSPTQSVSPTVSPKPLVSPKVTPTQSPTPKLSTTDKININTADKSMLMTLKGIKDAKSDAIILHRQTYGPFQKIEDVMNVNGIGQATFEEIKGIITVGDIVPTPSPVFYASGGGGGGGGGGSSSSPTPTPSVTPTPSPTPEPEGDTATLGDIVINEIAWMGSKIDGTANANAEWIELYNASSSAINLTGWTLAWGTVTIHLGSVEGNTQELNTTEIPAHGFLLLERTSNNSVPGISADVIYTGALRNTEGEHLVLKDISGTVIDEVDSSSGWPAGDNTTKETAQKMDSGWITATSTPKAENQANTTAQNPSAVTNLVAAHNSPTITATWTAPDMGSYSPASLSYDLRYSTTNFPDDDTWDLATKVASSSLPSVGEEGASESASFDITYEYGQTLYFALKTGLSDISNIATISFLTAIDANAWAMLGKDQYHTSFAANITGPTSPTATISRPLFEAVGNVTQPVSDADGNIYFGASDGTPANSKIYSLLAENGSKSWEYPTNVSIGTPAVLSDGTVYFGRIGAGGVLAFTALNPDGSKKWDYDDASTVNHVTVSSNGEPHFTYNSGTNKLAVLNPEDGSEKVKISSIDVGGTPVVLDDGTIITAKRNSAGNHIFTAFYANGSQSWQTYTSESNNRPLSDPSYDKSTGITYSAAGPKLFSIPSGGSILSPTDIAPFNYSAATTVAISADTLYVGFNSLGSGSTVNGGGVFVNYASISGADWTNPDRAKTEDSSYATVLLDGAVSVSKYLKATGFNFNIPANSSINGIKVEIRKSSAGKQVKDLSVRIVKNGSISGDNKADLNSWPAGAGTYIVHGGESDLWGLSLTPSDINADDFGVAIAATLPVGGQHIGGIDNIKITAYYTEPSLLYTLNKSDLATSWSFQAEGKINQQIAVDQAENVYFSTQSGHLYSVDTNGSQNWHISAGVNSVISPILTPNGLVWGYGGRVVLVD